MMKKEADVVGCDAEDGGIYCVDCINKSINFMEEIDTAITTEDSGDTLLFCEGCEKEIK